MIKALKVAMIVWAATGILFGLAYIFIPEQLRVMFGYDKGLVYVKYLMAVLGVSFIAPSVFLIAAARDPLKHIYWVKFAILWALLLVAIYVYSIIAGYVDFSQAGGGIIVDGAFAVLFIVFYPWRAARASGPVPTTK